MNYSRIYDELINNAKSRNPVDKGEVHHILPGSMGGSNCKDNLVKLTYREHFIAHMLLFYIHRNCQMAFALGRMRNSRSGAVSSRTYAIAREIHRTTVSKWSKEYMKAKTVFKNIETGEKRILPVDEIDRTVWKGINYGNSLKRTVKKHHTIFKDSHGNTYFLDPSDPKIAELNLVGVGCFKNATIAAAKRLRARPWYYKFETDLQKDVILLVPSLYDWYTEKYDESRPKATGIVKWMRYNNIILRTKMFSRFFNEFKTGWKPDTNFYEVYNEIIKNCKN